jgi:hypothetical protein
MRWVLTRFLGAVVAGVGWKLGADAYEALKQRLRRRGEDTDVENGAGVEETVDPQQRPSDENGAALVFTFKGKE